MPQEGGNLQIVKVKWNEKTENEESLASLTVTR